MTMDLTATILAACGVNRRPAGPGWRGRAADTHGQGRRAERTLFWRIRHPAYPNSQKAVRRGRFKYLTDGRVGLLFDLETDPGETAK